VTPLESWLFDATRGLTAESAAQVRAEIQQHYDSASEAGDDAIAALGNPRAANRAYRKVLLTRQEAVMAPVLTRPKRRSLSAILLTSAINAAFVWFAWTRHWFQGFFWPLMIAFNCTVPLAWFFPATTLKRSRIYAWVAGVQSVAIAGIFCWYEGWATALVLGPFFFLLNSFFNYQRLSIFRKLAAGQTYSLLPLPEEPRLSHREAIYLHALRNGDPSEKFAAPVVILVVAGLTVWLPATFFPIATCLIAIIVAQRTLPIYTEERGRRFRIAKWTAMAVAAALPVLYGARMPWIGAIWMAFLFVGIDLRQISIRRKLPVAEWPKRLYC
jgi:hypothetical protein